MAREDQQTTGDRIEQENPNTICHVPQNAELTEGHQGPPFQTQKAVDASNESSQRRDADLVLVPTQDKMTVPDTTQSQPHDTGSIEARQRRRSHSQSTDESLSLYGDKFWTPQLLYIESIYFIRSNQDPQARAVLQSIINKFPHTPMSDKAATMLDVLSRRRQIEDYLTRLQIKRAADDDTITVSNFPAAARTQNNRPGMVRNDSNMLKRDSTSDWARAKAREAALARDSSKAKPIAGPGKIKVDSAIAKVQSLNSAFSLNPDAPHSVVMVMTKVDPVYVSEARNAFNGYNQENFYDRQLTGENASLSDSVKLLMIGTFASDKAALTYLTSAKALAPRQIVPWLPADKYTFLIISVANLQLLLNNKDLNAYHRFLSAAYPGKF